MPIDYKRYPPNWLSEIRPAVLKRAENCCEQCGLENHSHAWSVPFAIRDDNGRYKTRRVWFRNKQDAFRECFNPNTVKQVKVVLTIAHLDHDEDNHEVELHRLKALCQVCHIRYDAIEKWERQLRKWKSNDSPLQL